MFLAVKVLGFIIPHTALKQIHFVEVYSVEWA